MKRVFSKIEEGQANDYLKRRLQKEFNNGLVNKLINCYSWHLPLKLSPDEILNNVLSIYGKYINLNPEKFRDQFVSHEGKKKLILKLGGFYRDDRVQEIMSSLIDLMNKDQGNNVCSWGMVNFTTTKQEDVFIRSLSTLHSQKAYYEYSCVLCCGFPSVELLGTKEDWDLLQSTLQSMPELDEFIAGWKNKLLSIITQMRAMEEDFWQSAITKHPYGSGSQADYSGWAIAFNPFNEKGSPVTNLLKEKDFLNLTIDIDVNIDDNGDEFQIKVIGGPTHLEFSGNDVFVKNQIEIKKV